MPRVLLLPCLIFFPIGFKLRNVPTASGATIEAVIAQLQAAREAGIALALAEDSKWRQQGAAARKRLTRDARALRWIERDDTWILYEKTKLKQCGDDVEKEGAQSDDW